MDSAPLRKIERPVPKNRFFTSCCVIVEASAHAAAVHIPFGVDFDRLPIEPMVLVEARVLRRDHGMLKIGRDLVEGMKV